MGVNKAPKEQRRSNISGFKEKQNKKHHSNKWATHRIYIWIYWKNKSWWGHKQTRPVKRVWEARIQTNRTKRWPRLTWDEVIEEILQKGKEKAGTLTRNKKMYAEFVHNSLIIYTYTGRIGAWLVQIGYEIPWCSNNRQLRICLLTITN